MVMLALMRLAKKQSFLEGCNACRTCQLLTVRFAGDAHVCTDQSLFKRPYLTRTARSSHICQLLEPGTSAPRSDTGCCLHHTV